MKARVYRVITGVNSNGKCYIVEVQTWRGWKDVNHGRTFTTQADAERYIEALSNAGTIVTIKVITEGK